MAATSSREESMTIRIGVSGAGVIGAVWISHASDIGAYPQNSTAGGRMVASVFPGPYRIPQFGWEVTSVYTNTCGRSAYRGPWLMETVGREMMLEIVARELGLDPAELRRRNMISSDELPYTTVTGAVYRGISSAEVFERALQTADYEEFRRVQARERERGRYLGIGIASFVEPTALGGSPYHAEVATVRVEAGGTVTVLMGTGSTGNSIETTIAQVVADQLGVEVEDVRVHQGDTAVSPAGSGTGGSRSALAAGGVARICAGQAREKVLQIAAHMLEASEDDLQIGGGTIAVKGSPGASLTLAQVATAAYTDPSKLPEGMEMGLEVTSRYNPPPMTHSDATHICMCEVDVRSGVVKLLDYVVGEDCGVLINPMVVEGQIAGGVAQGIGGALLEHMAHDDQGNPLAITFKDYLLPTSMDVPDIRYAHLETPSDTPGGHKGMAEGSAIGSPPAVSNAIADALAPFHVRVTTHPLDPDRILALIAAAA